MNPVPLALGQMLDAAAERFPDKPAVVFKDTRVTYAELAARAEAFARGLLALGLGPGDHVVLWIAAAWSSNRAPRPRPITAGSTQQCSSSIIGGPPLSA
ncbi:MAG: hypothetical protein DME13_22205 [Candidatus Rokuibacteriota bacterium]|nr:MAG: hypothetical protein DME13_22205 [Candidatus Rokubacteria bacterium]